MKNYKLILTLVLVGLLILFVIQNATAVQIRFLWWTLSMSTVLMVFFILAIGIIIGWLLRELFGSRKGPGPG